MLLILSVVAGAVVLGYVLGGRLSAFEGFRLRWWVLAPLGLFMQLAPVPVEGDVGDAIRVGLLIASYLVLFAFALSNIRVPGVPLILLGLAMNFVVITVNTGMPVSREALIASHQEEAVDQLEGGDIAKHHLATDDDALLFLADVIPVGRPFDQVVSAGDLVAYAGVMWLVAGIMRRRRSATEPAPPPERSGPRPAGRRRSLRPGSSTPSGTQR